MISSVLSPGRISNAAKADQAIDVWEERMAKLSAEYGETVSAKVKVAVLYATLPKDFQEKVLDKCGWNLHGVKDPEALNIYCKLRRRSKT